MRMTPCRSCQRRAGPMRMTRIGRRRGGGSAGPSRWPQPYDGPDRARPGQRYSSHRSTAPRPLATRPGTGSRSRTANAVAATPSEESNASPIEPNRSPTGSRTSRRVGGPVRPDRRRRADQHCERTVGPLGCAPARPLPQQLRATLGADRAQVRAQAPRARLRDAGASAECSGPNAQCRSTAARSGRRTPSPMPSHAAASGSRAAHRSLTGRRRPVRRPGTCRRRPGCPRWSPRCR